MKIIHKNSLILKGYIFYPEVNDWIKWISKMPVEDFGGYESEMIWEGHNPLFEDYSAIFNCDTEKLNISKDGRT